MTQKHHHEQHNEALSQAPEPIADDSGDVAALTVRVAALEQQLAALQRATAHITSIQPIKA